MRERREEVEERVKRGGVAAIPTTPGINDRRVCLS